MVTVYTEAPGIQLYTVTEGEPAPPGAKTQADVEGAAVRARAEKALHKALGKWLATKVMDVVESVLISIFGAIAVGGGFGGGGNPGMGAGMGAGGVVGCEAEAAEAAGRAALANG